MPSIQSSASFAGNQAETSLLLVEQHALLRVALRSFLDATAGLTVVAEADGIEQAMELARLHRPSVVLVSDAADHEGGIPALRRAAPDACVILLTRGARAPTVSPAEASALDHLPSHAGLTELCAVIESSLQGRCASCAFSPQCPVPKRAASLSPRERQVAVRIAHGLTSKQIAAELGIGLRTVHTYRESLARKLGASSAAVVTRHVLETERAGWTSVA